MGFGIIDEILNFKIRIKMLTNHKYNKIGSMIARYPDQVMILDDLSHIVIPYMEENSRG